jgi:mannosyltransferase OCH1-like enzyme
MIPKIVHYCWYGNNPKSAETLYYIETWRKFLPNYEFIEWNEGNCDKESLYEKMKSESEE